MKTKWFGIYDRGILEKERIHFQAISDLELEYYLVLDTNVINANQVGAGNRNSYWFTPLKVKAGENVVVYSRAGVYSKEVRPDGSVFHFLFRGLSTPIYQQPDSRAVLFELGSWNTTG